MANFETTLQEIDDLTNLMVVAVAVDDGPRLSPRLIDLVLGVIEDERHRPDPLGVIRDPQRQEGDC